MASLFDFITAAMALGGGARNARMEGEKAESENKYRSEDIAVKREGIRSQEKLTASQQQLARELEAGRQTHEEKLQGKRIDWDAERLKKEQEFTKSQNEFTRTHAKELADLHIKAQESMQEKAIKSSELIAKNEQETKMAIAKMNEKLARLGFQIDEKKMAQDFSYKQMGVLVEAASLAIKATTGTEGLMTAATQGGEMGTLLDKKQEAVLKTILGVIDPDNKMKLKGFKEDNYIKKIKVDVQGGSSQAIDLLRGMGADPRLLPPKSTEAPTNTPSVNLPPILPTSLPKPGMSLDQTVVTPFGLNTYGINPQDVLGLDRATQHIKSFPPEEQPQALAEYGSMIENPMNKFIGDTSSGNPIAYRQNMLKYLRNSTGFDITK